MSRRTTRRGILGSLAAAAGTALAECRSDTVDAEFDTPRAALIDEQFDVTVRGIPADRQVRVKAQTTVGESAIDTGTDWSAAATFGRPAGQCRYENRPRCRATIEVPIRWACSGR
jgi:hypothetical protein